tara:strand:+ start:1241 stop:1366 length:126 start_codon:yes stop_codon:yes gene_type:complete
MEKNKEKTVKISITYSVFDSVPLENISVGWIYPYIIVEEDA